MSRARRGARAAALAGGLALVGASGPLWAGKVLIPLVCDHGPDGQQIFMSPSLPASVPAESRFTVRVDGVAIGTIDHFGLNYVYDMVYELGLPAGARYVDGSAQVVPDTGSPNVRAGARVVHERDALRLVLPARVKNHDAYTPPSFTFDLVAPSGEGTALALRFARYRVRASVIVLGTIVTTCEPRQKPFVLAATTVGR
jgi:hypothetical protein